MARYRRRPGAAAQPEDVRDVSARTVKRGSAEKEQIHNPGTLYK